MKEQMTYASFSHINTVKDVEQFLYHLVIERRLNIPPDNIFEDYICERGLNAFSFVECTIYNCLLNESYRVCEMAGVDIYDVCLEIPTK